MRQASARTTRTLVKALLALVVAAAILPAASEMKPETAFRAALETENVKGDLKAAIEQYRKLAEGADRAIAAKALIRMAECHQKLGDAKAREIYERVIRDFSDQTEAVAAARERLGDERERKSAGIVARQVWAGPDVDILGTISPDGRYLSYAHWKTGDLGVRDLVTGINRLLTNKGSWNDSDEYAEESTISCDGKQVAYSWFNKDFRYDLRIANLNGEPNPRQLFDNEDVAWMGPYDWTPDGKWIAVQIARRDRTAQIGLLSTADGSLRVLKSVDWRGPTKMFFSPDGRYLAYDLPREESQEQRDIFLMAIDGSREIPAVVHPANDVVMGWTPDGKHLLFGSDRTGSMAVWALAMAEGKPQTGPQLVKTDIGDAWSMGITRSGRMYYGGNSSAREIHVAEIDFASGNMTSPPTKPVQRFVGTNRFPSWSPDGKYLAYVSRRGHNRRILILALRSTETGKTRELRLDMGYAYGRLLWTPDGRYIFTNGNDRKGKRGIYRIDLKSGEAVPALLSEPGDGLQPAGVSPDGRKLYYRVGSIGNSAERKHYSVIERDLESGKERKVLDSNERILPVLSPNGRHLAFRVMDRSTKAFMLMVASVEGGEPEEIFKVAFPQIVGSFAWSPDGQSLLFGRILSEDGEQTELWRVSLADGSAQKVADIEASQLSVHPNGRQIAFLSGEFRAEVWALENFLPTLQASK